MHVAFIESLVAKAAIREAMAIDVKQWALRNKKPIGMIAVDHGLIVGRQIDEVLDRQKHSKRKFGELAGEMGLLSREKVDVLLQVQQLRMLTGILEALALCGIQSLEEGLLLLSDFVAQRGRGAFDVRETAEAV